MLVMLAAHAAVIRLVMLQMLVMLVMLVMLELLGMLRMLECWECWECQVLLLRISKWEVDSREDKTTNSLSATIIAVAQWTTGATFLTKVERGSKKDPAVPPTQLKFFHHHGYKLPTCTADSHKSHPHL